jgi:hypothetical protein
MRRIASILVLQMLFAAGGAAQSSWTPTVDTVGNSRAQYLSRDTAECRSMAQQASGGTGAGQAARGAVRGGAVGAAGGAAMGAVLGNAGRGAALGAIGGGVSRGVRQTSSADAAFQQAFSNCLRGRGHNVLN